VNSNFADYLDTLDDLLTVNQVCDLLGTHHDTLYRWVRAEEIPAIRMGSSSKPLLRFVPKDLALWVRESPCFFHGPARFITDWMERQVKDRGGPRFLLDPLPKVLQLTGYDWLEAAQHIKIEPALSSYCFHLMDDFSAAVKKLPIADQRQLLEDIEAGKANCPSFTCEDAE
jgi:excisionase family DNA binding protein